MSGLYVVSRCRVPDKTSKQGKLKLKQPDVETLTLLLMVVTRERGAGLDRLNACVNGLVDV